MDRVPASLRAILEEPGARRTAGLILVGLALLWGAARLVRLLRGSSKRAGISRSSLRRAARRATSRGDHLEAGRLYETAEAWVEAAEAYERGSAWATAGRLWEAAGQPARAARLFEQGGELARAGEMQARAGNHAKAAALFQRAGQEVKAAEAYERAGDLERAAALYTKYEAFERAAELRARQGQVRLAAELAERAVTQRKLRGEAGEAGLDELRRLARRAGELYAQAEQPARGAALLEACGLEEAAAEHYCAASEWQRALDLLMRHRRFERAAAICKAQGLEEQLHLVEGERALAEGREATAGQEFEAAGVWWRAAEMYHRARDFSRAATMYARQGDEERSAEMYAAAGEPGRAAAALLRLGRAEEAAVLYRQAGDLREAARALREAGDFFGAGVLLCEGQAQDEAILLFQQVSPDSDRYVPALLRLGELFLARGLDGPAREKFEQAVALQASGPDAVRASYELARIHDRHGDLAEALRLFEKVLAEQMDYRDVGQRVAELRDRLAEQARAGGAATQMVPPPAALRYRILAELGRGGMGIVYRAEDTILQRVVAYKVLPDAIRQDTKAMQAFLQEARIAASLHHPNIVTVYDAGQTEQEAYIVMEYVEGRSLQELLDERASLPASKALGIFRQACLSLIHAHERQVVHRDVKPANMMIAANGVVKLTDFGLAAVTTQAMGRVTSVRGTPFYMAPEQIRGESVSAQADQYSLGCTLYHMLTGRPPFIEGDVLYHHIHSEPPGPRSWEAKLPVWLDAIVLRTLRKAQADRFPSVRILLQELDAWLASARSGP
ncbi:MAG TPA: protein kinase [Candidatus Sulfotelmatobacter sp.]|nr:protein kinase [Candidatus Sulfotelmatobacter sp.]